LVAWLINIGMPRLLAGAAASQHWTKFDRRQPSLFGGCCPGRDQDRR